LKENRLFIIIFILSLVCYVVIENMAPKEIDWSNSFSKDDTIPHGSYIIYDLLPTLFPGQEIISVRNSSYKILKNNKDKKINYIFISNSIKFDKYDCEKLYSRLKTGSSIFIAAHNYSGKFAKDLKITTSYYPDLTKPLKIYLANKKLDHKRRYLVSKNTASFYFKSIPKKSVILGKNEKGTVNFIKIRYGKGFLFLSTLPLNYGNHALVEKKNYRYIFKSLSYLPVQKTLWDEFYKLGHFAPQTPLRYILSVKPLKWAYNTFLVAFILFVIFKIKREQRIIPVIKPLTNTTIDFITTVGKLYYQQKNNRDIAGKIIHYFLSSVKSSWGINVFNIDESVIRQISARTALSELKIHDLINYLENIKNSKTVTDKQLVKLHKNIHEFKRHM